MNELNNDDNSHWKWGLIYYNPHNPKLIINKRYGLGWTFNFAHKGTWLFLLMVIGVVVLVRILVD
ncbi:DUF5808 domain-containing protein [Mucilaginibacter glaciei]|uniref:DUF5808 domain-containing protein n=1 Tax=Mucilaginibacter glaciei TaxID=2772109 RepID=A0A926NNS8_9SPHI|nr:DUF5808 domain-containing protein [Mucilaginibacter glaciei]MBD1393136.1 hypothetical protein [Mucilaginibacter glaciei]